MKSDAETLRDQLAKARRAHHVYESKVAWLQREIGKRDERIDELTRELACAKWEADKPMRQASFAINRCEK